MDWWVKRSLLCRRLIKEEELLRSGAEIGHVVGAFRRAVSGFIHPDKNKGVDPELIQALNGAVGRFRDDATTKNMLEGMLDLVDQQVAYRAPVRVIMYPKGYPLQDKRQHGY